MALVFFKKNKTNGFFWKLISSGSESQDGWGWQGLCAILPWPAGCHTTQGTGSHLGREDRLGDHQIPGFSLWQVIRIFPLPLSRPSVRAHPVLCSL